MFVISLKIFAFALLCYTVVLLVRAIFDMVTMVIPAWQPYGLLAKVKRTIYGLTNPPLRAIKKIIPPIRIGSLAIDTSYLVLFLMCYVVSSLLIHVASATFLQ